MNGRSLCLEKVNPDSSRVMLINHPYKEGSTGPPVYGFERRLRTVIRGERLVDEIVWSFIGGKLHLGVEPEAPQQGAQRETLEETGWKFSNSDFIYVTTVPPVPGRKRSYFCHSTHLYYAEKQLRGSRAAAKLRSDSLEFQWFKLEEIPREGNPVNGAVLAPKHEGYLKLFSKEGIIPCVFENAESVV